MQSVRTDLFDSQVCDIFRTSKFSLIKVFSHCQFFVDIPVYPIFPIMRHFKYVLLEDFLCLQ